MGSEHAVIAVTVDAWRMDEQSESFEELEGSEREGRGTVRCGTGKPIDDAFAPGSLEPIEGEGRTRTVAQESFEPSAVAGGDVDRGIDAEPSNLRLTAD
jgi:hypothetical protein